MSIEISLEEFFLLCLSSHLLCSAVDKSKIRQPFLSGSLSRTLLTGSGSWSVGLVPRTRFDREDLLFRKPLQCVACRIDFLKTILTSQYKVKSCSVKFTGGVSFSFLTSLKNNLVFAKLLTLSSLFIKFISNTFIANRLNRENGKPFWRIPSSHKNQILMIKVIIT